MQLDFFSKFFIFTLRSKKRGLASLILINKWFNNLKKENEKNIAHANSMLFDWWW